MRCAAPAAHAPQVRHSPQYAALDALLARLPRGVTVAASICRNREPSTWTNPDGEDALMCQTHAV
jgi:hypothetical protein